MKLPSPLSVFLVAFMACCAAPQTGLSVKSLLKKSKELDRQIVEVRGKISVDEHGLINFYSGKDECVGLLLTQADMDKYSSWDKRDALVTGTLESEGCGKVGFCDEHLCGPAILTGVTIRRPGSPSVSIASAKHAAPVAPPGDKGVGGPANTPGGPALLAPATSVRCDTASLSAVFDNPQAYLGRTFCGSVTVVTDDSALKVFPAGRVPQDRTGTVGFFDIDTSRQIRSLMRQRNDRQRFYVEAKIEGPPPMLSQWIGLRAVRSPDLA